MVARTHDPARAEALLAHLLIGDDEDGVATNDLLEEFFHGFPVENLRVLLNSETEAAVRKGAWIASELGKDVAPLMDDIAQLMDHPSGYVRFFLIDAVHVGAGRNDGAALAQAVLSIHDVDEAVRWKGMRFLSLASSDRLVWALPYVKQETVREALTWLVDVRRVPDAQSIVERLESDDADVRKFAAAAALRLSGQDRTPLESAAQSRDPEVRTFAKEELESIARLDAIRARQKLRRPYDGPA